MSLMSQRNARLMRERRPTLQVGRMPRPAAPRQGPVTPTRSVTGRNTQVSTGSMLDQLASQAGPRMQRQAQGGDGGGGFGGALGFVLGAPLKTIEYATMGQRAIMAGLENLARVTPEALEMGLPILAAIDEDREDIGSWWERTQDPTYGFGTAMEKTGNQWVDRALGFVGDVATDPLSYVGGIGFATRAGAAGGRAGRLAALGKLQDSFYAANKSARLTDDQVAALQRIGKGGFSKAKPEELAAMGVEGGIRLTANPFFGSSASKSAWKIPGSEKVTRPLSRARTATGERLADVPIIRSMQNVRTPQGMEREYDQIFRGISGAEGGIEGALTSARLEKLTRRTRGLLRPFQSVSDQIANDVRKLSTEEKQLVNDAVEGIVTVSDPKLAPIVQEIQDLYRGAWDTVTKEGMPVSLRQNYSPHILSRDAIAWRRDPTNSGQMMAPTGFFTDRRYDPSGVTMGRRMAPGDEFTINGNTFTLETGTISEFNRKARDAGLNFDFFESDPGVIAQKYINMLSDDFGLFKAAPELITQQGGRGLIIEGVTESTDRYGFLPGKKVTDEDSTLLANELGVDQELVDRGVIKAQKNQSLSDQLNRTRGSIMRDEHEKAKAELDSLRREMTDVLRTASRGGATSQPNSLRNLARRSVERVDDLSAEIGARRLEAASLTTDIEKLSDRAVGYQALVDLARDERDMAGELLSEMQRQGVRDFTRQLQRRRRVLGQQIEDARSQLDELNKQVNQQRRMSGAARRAELEQRAAQDVGLPSKPDPSAVGRKAVIAEVERLRATGERVPKDLAERYAQITRTQAAELVTPTTSPMSRKQVTELRQRARNEAREVLSDLEAELETIVNREAPPQMPTRKQRNLPEYEWARTQSEIFSNRYNREWYVRNGWLARPNQRGTKIEDLVMSMGIDTGGKSYHDAIERYLDLVDQLVAARKLAGGPPRLADGLPKARRNVIQQVAAKMDMDEGALEVLLRQGETAYMQYVRNEGGLSEQIRPIIDTLMAESPEMRRGIAQVIRESPSPEADLGEILLELDDFTPPELDLLNEFDLNELADLIESPNRGATRAAPPLELEAREQARRQARRVEERAARIPAGEQNVLDERTGTLRREGTPNLNPKAERRLPRSQREELARGRSRLKERDPLKRMEMETQLGDLEGKLKSVARDIRVAKRTLENHPDVTAARLSLAQAGEGGMIVPGRRADIPRRPDLDTYKKPGSYAKGQELAPEVREWSERVDEIMRGVPFKRTPIPRGPEAARRLVEIRRRVSSEIGLDDLLEEAQQLRQQQADIRSRLFEREFIADDPESMALLSRETREAIDPGAESQLGKMPDFNEAITNEQLLQAVQAQSQAVGARREIGDIGEQLSEIIRNPQAREAIGREAIDPDVVAKQRQAQRVMNMSEQQKAKVLGRKESSERWLAETNAAMEAAASSLPEARKSASWYAEQMDLARRIEPSAEARRIFRVDSEGTATKGTLPVEDFFRQLDPEIADHASLSTAVALGEAERLAKQIDPVLREFERTGTAGRSKEMVRAMRFVVDEANWSALSPDIFGAGGPLIHRDLKTYMQNVRKIASDSRFWREVDTLTGLFKTYATLTPAFHIRNAMSGMFNNAADGIRVSEMARARKVMREYGKALKGGQDSITKWYNDQANVIINSDTGTTMKDALDAVAGSGAGGRYREHGVGDRASARYRATEFAFENRLTHWVGKKPGTFVESTLRLPAAIDTLAKGGDVTEAMLRINRLHFDYSEVSNFDVAMRRIIPFWTFMSRNTPLMISMMATQPRAFAKYMQLKKNLSGEPEEGEPEYFDQIGAFRLADVEAGGLPVYLQPDLPFSRLEEDVQRYTDLSNPAGMLSDTSPFISAPLEYAFGQDAFTGRRYNEDDVRLAGPLEKPIELLARLTNTGQETPQGNYAIPEKTFQLFRAMIPLYDRSVRLAPGMTTGQADEDARSRVLESRLRSTVAPWFRQLSPQQQQATLRSERFDAMRDRDLQRALSELDR